MTENEGPENNLAPETPESQSLSSNSGLKKNPIRRVLSRLKEINWKVKFSRILPRSSTRRFAKVLPRSLEPAALTEWFTSTLSPIFQKQKVGTYSRLIAVFICLYFLSDLAALGINLLIPDPPLPISQRNYSKLETGSTSIEKYSPIFTRNLFNSQGLIPGDESEGDTGKDPGGPPIRTSLALNLIGTIVVEDPLRSVATIQDKSLSDVFALRVEDEIPSKIRILEIESKRVIFLNLSSHRREYLEIPEGASSTKISVNKGIKSTGAIEKLSPTQFQVPRSELNKAFENMNDILTQARAIPNFENGKPAGYKLIQIVDGSIYKTLGLQNEDTICGMNGQPLNDIGQALSTLNAVKAGELTQLQLCIQRDGKKMEYAYDIN